MKGLKYYIRIVEEQTTQVQVVVLKLQMYGDVGSCREVHHHKGIGIMIAGRPVIKEEVIDGSV